MIVRADLSNAYGAAGRSNAIEVREGIAIVYRRSNGVQQIANSGYERDEERAERPEQGEHEDEGAVRPGRDNDDADYEQRERSIHTQGVRPEYRWEQEGSEGGQNERQPDATNGQNKGTQGGGGDDRALTSRRMRPSPTASSTSVWRPTQPLIADIDALQAERNAGVEQPTERSADNLDHRYRTTNVATRPPRRQQYVATRQLAQYRLAGYEVGKWPTGNQTTTNSLARLLPPDPCTLR